VSDKDEQQEQASAPYRIIIRHSETDMTRTRLHKLHLAILSTDKGDSGA
jgi:hypothetical protein